MACDNASNNNAMIKELTILAPKFTGSPSHTCCFLHIVNLIAKLLICQFNGKKATVEEDAELAGLTRELVEEESKIQIGGDSDDEAVKEIDNDEGLMDKMDDLMDVERIEVERLI